MPAERHARGGLVCVLLGILWRIVSVEIYLLEHFALLFLFFAVYCLIRALQRDQM